MTIGVIIQARMGSTRLPGKVLLYVAGKTILEHIITRINLIKASVTPVIATSQLQQDDVIEEFCNRLNVQCFRGDHLDVLSRYMECASFYQFTHIIRLTADNPFTDPEELDRLIYLHLETGADYSHSFGRLPLGVGAEIFSFEALKQSYLLGHEPQHREHVNEYILENSSLFHIAQLEVPKEKHHPKLRLTIDTLADYHMACKLMGNAEELLTTQEAIRLCSHFV